MGIYRGTAPLKAYKGDMQPVNVYKGSTKVAGWHSASYSGTSPLTVDCDYNVPPDALTVDGKCVQTGTPSPDSPAPISSITGNVTITGADGAVSDTATVAFGSAVCASLPDGTHDTYDAVTGVMTKRVNKITEKGTEGFHLASEFDNTNGVSIYGDNANHVQVIGSSSIYCDRLTPAFVDDKSLTDVILMRKNSSIVIINVNKAHLATYDLAGVLSWLAANPVTIYYKLATPTTVQLTPHLPVVRTGIKTLSVGADVVPTISATVKSMD